MTFEPKSPQHVDEMASVSSEEDSASELNSDEEVIV